MNDKSNYSSDFSLTYKNITSVISNLYLQSGNYDLSCEYGKFSCPNLECDGNILNLIWKNLIMIKYICQKIIILQVIILLLE